MKDVEWLPPLAPGPYLGVVPREQLLCDGSHVVQQQLVPLLLVAHLVHVDVDGGHVLVAPLDPLVLRDAHGQERWLQMLNFAGTGFHLLECMNFLVVS